MRLSQITVLISSFFIMCSTVAAAPNNTYLADLDYLQKMGNDIYCYWDLKKTTDNVNWDQIYSGARERMSTATTVSEYYQILRNAISAVHDGHVDVWLSEPASSIAPYYMPITLREVAEGKIVVASIDRSAFIGEPEITVGDEVSSINGVAVARLIEQNYSFVSGSTIQMRRRAAIRWLTTMPPFGGIPEGNPILTIKNPANPAPQETEIPWLVYDDSVDPSISETPAPYRITDSIEAKILPGNIGYLRVGSMIAPEPMEERIFLQYIEIQLINLLGTNGLIIDVRGNGGGWSTVGDTIMSHLISLPTRRARISPRLSLATLVERPSIFKSFEPDPETGGRFALWKDVIVAPAPESLRYIKNVIILADAGCFSACDTFVDSMTSNGLATIMGEPTGGGTGNPLEFNLPSGLATARFSTTRGMSNSGRYIEGNGTTPDIFARLTAEDVAAGRDSVLLKAYETLRSGGQDTSLSNSRAISGNHGFADFSLHSEKVEPAFIEERRLIDFSSEEF